MKVHINTDYNFFILILFIPLSVKKINTYTIYAVKEQYKQPVYIF